MEEVNEYENLELLKKDKDIEKNENDLDEENIQDLKEKIKRSGVIYISSIPLGMNINSLRALLSDYGVKRIYLVPLKNKVIDDNGKKVQGYKEGWVEFEEKLYAKLCEYRLNGKPIGGKRTCPYRDTLWTIKYLHKFKWHNLTEKINFNKNVREKKLKTELAQSRRENDFIIKNYQKSKLLNKKKKRDKDEEDFDINKNQMEEMKEDKNKIKNEDNKLNSKEEIRKRFKQKTPIIKENI